METKKKMELDLTELEAGTISLYNQWNDGMI
jgi:hypothetical protein